MPDDDDELDAAREDMAIEEEKKRIRKLVDDGAEWNPDTGTYSLDGKQFDEHGNPL